MKHLTVSLDKATLQRAHRAAGERGMTLARYINSVLRERIRWSAEFEAAYHSWRTRKPLARKKD